MQDTTWSDARPRTRLVKRLANQNDQAIKLAEHIEAALHVERDAGRDDTIGPRLLAIDRPSRTSVRGSRSDGRVQPGSMPIFLIAFVASGAVRCLTSALAASGDAASECKPTAYIVKFWMLAGSGPRSMRPVTFMNSLT